MICLGFSQKNKGELRRPKPALKSAKRGFTISQIVVEKNEFLALQKLQTQGFLQRKQVVQSHFRR